MSLYGFCNLIRRPDLTVQPSVSKASDAVSPLISASHLSGNETQHQIKHLTDLLHKISLNIVKHLDTEEIEFATPYVL